MAALPTAQQALARWQQGTAAAAPRYVAGVQASADWAGNFAAAEPAMVAGFNAAASSGKITAGAQAVGTAGWRTQTVAKAGNWTTGVSSPLAAANYQAGYTKLAGWIGQAQQAISGMPSDSYAARKARANAYMDTMHSLSGGI